MPSFLSALARDTSAAWNLINSSVGVPLAGRVLLAGDSAARRRGLLGRDAFNDEALILVPCAAVHTWFMRFPIDVIYVDRSGTVLKCVKRLRPWRVSGSLGAFATIELPAGTIESSRTHTGHQLEIRSPGR